MILHSQIQAETTIEEGEDDTPHPDSERSGMVEEAEESGEEKVTVKQEEDDTPQPDSERSGMVEEAEESERGEGDSEARRR
jgi:hypothetical protein